MAEIVDFTGYKNVYSVTGSLNRAVKSMNVDVQAITRNSHIYIMKTI